MPYLIEVADWTESLLLVESSHEEASCVLSTLFSGPALIIDCCWCISWNGCSASQERTLGVSDKLIAVREGDPFQFIRTCPPVPCLVLTLGGSR